MSDRSGPAGAPAAERTLYLVRHGRTALNAEGRLRGLADPPLDAEGIDEAEALARELERHGIAAVHTSPLQRAFRTGQAIAAKAGLEAVADPRFNDRDYGPWTGEVKAEVEARWGSVDAAPGVETVDRVLARVRPALDAVLHENPTGAVVVVTHDAVIRPLLAMLDPQLPTVTAPTGSYSQLRLLRGRWTVAATDLKPDRRAGRSTGVRDPN